MSDLTRFTDPDGFEIQIGKVGELLYPPAEGITQRVPALQKLKARGDDVLLLAYQKSGTHWVWEMVQMLARNSEEHIVGEKGKEFLEFIDLDVLENLKSPRILNTHMHPEVLPQELITRKCKIIYVQRNPKDVFVSFYNHCVGLERFYKYGGKFSGFFELMMNGHVESGSWFDYTLKYEEFFKQHPDIPLLRLHYEDLKQDLLEGVRQLAEFCHYPVTEEKMTAIAEACQFSNMKKFKVATVNSQRKSAWRDGNYNMYRKGVSGDWKNWFTVAQNERFDAECERRLAGSNVVVRWVN